MNGAFVDLTQRTEQQLQTIIDELRARRPAESTTEQQVVDLYASYVDMGRRNALGLRPLQAAVADTLKVSDKRALAHRMGGIGYKAIAEVSVMQDPAMPSRYVLTVGQGGLGLPGLEYYLKAEAPYDGVRAADPDYIADVFRRAGIVDGERKAAAILAFETGLAKVHWSPEQSRDPLRANHVMSVGQLVRYAPGFDWQGFLGGAGYGDAKRVNLTSDTALRDMAAVLPRRRWQRCGRMRPSTISTTGRRCSPSTGSMLTSISSSAVLPASTSSAPSTSRRWISLAPQPPMAEQVGKLYATRYFPAESKAAMQKLVGLLRAALRERLAQSPWMDQPTREAAITKLDAITVKIGYPDQWFDFRSVGVSKDDLLGNWIRYEQWQRQDEQAMLKGPYRKLSWTWEAMPHRSTPITHPAPTRSCFQRLSCSPHSSTPMPIRPSTSPPSAP